MLAALKTAWARKRLSSPDYAHLFDGHPDEMVSVDCETTSLNVREAELLSIGAVRIRGNRVLTSESFYMLVKPERLPEGASVAVHGLRPIDVSIGGRPLVGYYLEYDVGVLNKYVKGLLNIGLPQQQIEVSGLYYDWKLKQNPDAYIDLRLQPMLDELEIPTLARHDALNDAITAAMILLAMRQRGAKV